jgi:hypothetical protein
MVVNCPQMSSVDFHSRCLLRDLRTLTPALIYASTCARIAAGCMAWHWSLGSLIFVAVPRDKIATGTEEPNLHVLTAAELNNWFAKLTNHDTQTIQYDADGPFFTHTEANCLHVEYPQKLERLPFLARTLATITYEVRTSLALCFGSPAGEFGTTRTRVLVIGSSKRYIGRRANKNPSRMLPGTTSVEMN